MTRVTIDQHLAWPETRVGHLLSWVGRSVEGWDDEHLYNLMYKQLEACDIVDEAHF